MQPERVVRSGQVRHGSVAFLHIRHTCNPNVSYVPSKYSRRSVAFFQILKRHVQPERVLRSRQVLTSWECAFLQVLLGFQRHVQPENVLRSQQVLTSWECSVSSGTPQFSETRATQTCLTLSSCTHVMGV